MIDDCVINKRERKYNVKILHICTGWPLSFQGGITNYVRNLAEIQCKNGLEVSVLGAPDNAQYSFEYIPYTSKIKVFNYGKLEDQDSLEKIRRIISKNNFDIIHIHALEYVDWNLYDILKGQHYIISLHDYCFICPRIYMYDPKGKVCDHYEEKACEKCVSYLDRVYYFRRLIEKINGKFNTSVRVPYLPQNITKIRYEKFIRLLNNADYILPVSKRVEEIYKKSGVNSKSKVLHIGNSSAENYNDEFEYNTDDHIIKICFLGRLSKYKGAELFIQIADHFKKNDNIEFHFLGYAGKYETELDKIGVINHGKYNQNCLSDILKGYDLGMVLSIWEDNGPQVVMELLNNHIPVIGTRMGGISDFISDKNGFIFNPYSQKEINQLYDFLDSVTPEKIYELKSNIKRTKTPQEHYEELMNVYNEVL